MKDERIARVPLNNTVQIDIAKTTKSARPLQTLGYFNVCGW